MTPVQLLRQCRKNLFAPEFYRRCHQRLDPLSKDSRTSIHLKTNLEETHHAQGHRTETGAPRRARR